MKIINDTSIILSRENKVLLTLNLINYNNLPILPPRINNIFFTTSISSQFARKIFSLFVFKTNIKRLTFWQKLLIFQKCNHHLQNLPRRNWEVWIIYSPAVFKLSMLSSWTCFQMCLRISGHVIWYRESNIDLKNALHNKYFVMQFLKMNTKMYEKISTYKADFLWKRTMNFSVNFQLKCRIYVRSSYNHPLKTNTSQLLWQTTNPSYILIRKY